MKHTITCLITAAVILGSFLPALAENEQESQPNASFGFAGSFSGFNAWERKKGDQHTRYDFTAGYGGGFVFEKMFNNILGIHSGLWLNRFNLDMRMKSPFNPFAIDPMTLFSTKMKVTGWSISFPLCLITSLNASFFSLNILAGIKYTQIVDSHVKLKNPLMSYKRYIDLLPYFNQPQFGFNLGIVLKFRIARFVDLFAGGICDLYVTELVRGSNDMALLFDFTAIAGVMFRTNLFPMSKTPQ
jgi:hypothetical protein